MPVYLVVPLVATALGTVAALLRTLLHHWQAMRRMQLLRHVYDEAPDGRCVQHLQAMAEALDQVNDHQSGPARQALRHLVFGRSSGAADEAGAQHRPPDPPVTEPTNGAVLPKRKPLDNALTIQRPITRIDIGSDGKMFVTQGKFVTRSAASRSATA